MQQHSQPVKICGDTYRCEQHSLAASQDTDGTRMMDKHAATLTYYPPVKIQTVTHTGVNDGQTCSNTHILAASQDTDGDTYRCE